MLIPRISEKVIDVIGPYVLFFLIIVLLLAFFWQANAFFGSLMNILYSFKITGSVKAVAVTVLVLSLILVGAYFLNKTVLKGIENLHSKMSNNLSSIIAVLFIFLALGAAVIILSSLSAHPLLSEYAIKLVNAYESKNGLPQSSIVPGWSHNDLLTVESSVPESENYLVYSLDGYENLQIGIWDGIPFIFQGRIENTEITEEKNKEKIDKNVYLVYDLKKSPKLIILKPETLKKYVKQIRAPKAGSMEVSSSTLILEVGEAVEKENMKPVTLV